MAFRTSLSVLGGKNPLDRPALPPIKSLEVEAEPEDLSIILLSPKKLPKIEYLETKSSELHAQLPVETEKEQVPLTRTELTSLEDLSCSVTELL